MSTERKQDRGRIDVALIFAVILGLLLGKAIRNIKIGILIGIALGLFIVFTGSLRSSRK